VVTHWYFCDRLANEFPLATVRPEPIFLKDGSIYTSAGITAGIDLALALVEEDHGHSVALNIARFLVMFLVRPGGQAQFSHMLAHQAVTSRPLRELQIWMMENLREDLSVEKLAERLGMSARHFTRVCLKDAKINPGQFVDRMRVEAARQMIDSSDLGLKEIADATGFHTADAMRRTFVSSFRHYGRRLSSSIQERCENFVVRQKRRLRHSPLRRTTQCETYTLEARRRPPHAVPLRVVCRDGPQIGQRRSSAIRIGARDYRAKVGLIDRRMRSN
jgi:transcriptional regulator GlxA family with amidase domain